MAENKDGLEVQIGTTQAPDGIYIKIMPNGPLMLYGTPPLQQEFITPNATGNSWAYKQGEVFETKNPTALCRCGFSKNKPYCDGAHKTAPVDLTETATFESSLKESELTPGPEVSLSDDEKLCAYARFCDNGQRVWNEVQLLGEEHKDLAVYIAQHCPGGRLIVWDNETKQPIEKKEDPLVGVVEDTGLHISAGYMLRGGIPVQSANGAYYEVRNRQALCRCGQSSNKPFCDGTHASMKFEDGLPPKPKAGGKTI